MTNTDLPALCNLYLHLSAICVRLGVVNRMTRWEKRQRIVCGGKNLSKATDKMTVRSKSSALVLEKLFKSVYARVNFPNQFGALNKPRFLTFCCLLTHSLTMFHRLLIGRR